MFGKSHEKQAGDHASAALSEARKAASQRFAEVAPLRDSVVEKAGVAGEKFAHGVDAVAPKVEAAKDTFVDDIMPKVAEAVAAVAATALAAKDSAKEGVDRAREEGGRKLQDYVDAAPQGFVDAVPGVEKSPRKSGKWLIGLGLAAAGAAVYAFLNAKNAKEDPWSTPRYDSATGTGTWQSGTTESKVDSAKEKVAAAGAAVAAKAADVKDKVADKVEEVRPTDASGKAEDAVDSASDAAGDAWDDVRGKDAGDKLGDAGDALADGDLGDAGDSFGDAAGDAWDDARGKDAGDKLEDAADSAGDAASDAWTDAKRWADDKTD
ncbi:MAG: hypothetical protein GX344_13245 [Intrasporangiaceae bacterium]|nr:hypothetical protein [Intrasporangiaceae bacterium]